MKMRESFLFVLMLTISPVQAAGLNDILKRYEATGAGPFSAQQGEVEWKRMVEDTGNAKSKSCQDCHGTDLTKPGRHAKTGKQIDPMAPSVNPQRLSDAKKIEKWFKRNCKWTWGRACTEQEKGNVLLYLQQQ